MLKRLQAWLLDRAGLSRESIAALDKPLPRRVGWLNTLGSAAMIVIVVQAVTGMFLALYYSPVPGGAYQSVQYLDHQVVMGRIVRGIHHYGASAAVIIVALHLLRVFFHGAFKPPRELIWLLGVVIFQLVLGLGFTGYLLPWDQKAYWATVVGTEVVGTVPFIGPALLQVTRGGGEIGAVTLTHFYAIHVLILPALLFPAVGLHMLFIWRKGPTPPGSRVGEVVPKEPTGSRFVQHQALKDAVVMGLAFGIVYALALFRPVDLEFMANPADRDYQPRPDWYFLFLFQFLRYVEWMGEWEWVPAVLVPGLVMVGLTLLPWLDRSPERRWTRRPLWSGLAIFGIASVVLLTLQAMRDAPENVTPRNAATNTRFPGGITNEERAGVQTGRTLFERTARPIACATCHQVDGKGGMNAPALDGIGRRKTYDWLLAKVRNPKATAKNSAMPAFAPGDLPDGELRALVDYLAQPRPQKPAVIYNSP